MQKKTKKKTPAQNKRIEELKHGVLYMAEQLGTERQLRKVFDKFALMFPNSWQMSEQQIRGSLAQVAISEGCFNELKSAFNYFDQLPKRRPNEQETRKGLLNYAKHMGIPEQQVLNIFAKYDNLLKTATTESERQNIAALGGVELHKLFGAKSALVMDGKTILPAEPGYEDVETGRSKFVKLD